MLAENKKKTLFPRKGSEKFEKIRGPKGVPYGPLTTLFRTQKDKFF